MELLNVVADPSDKRVPEVARACLAALGTQLLRLKEQILEFDRMIMAWHRSTPDRRDNAELGEVRSDRINHCGLLADGACGEASGSSAAQVS
jgi:hypothetical protein